ncbi:MAG: sulfur carrier protein ThiS adenylyltransferase ThiF [Anaerostipes sp.]|nr:sulfur carrier protein ThiS adenylyltransferase ThiF [Anaerostipes sp.]
MNQYNLPSKDEFEQMIYERHTPKVHDKVKKGNVAVAGLGGLGSHIAIALARMGVGFLHLVDFDVVEPSNLNRQEYRISHLGMAKTEALKEQLLEINPYIEIRTDNLKVTEDNAVELFQKDEIVCEAFDGPEQKAMLINTLLSEKKDVKIVSGTGMAGYGKSNEIITKKINEQLYICGDFVNGAKPGWGLMAPRVMICAGHEANKVIELLVKETV